MIVFFLCVVARVSAWLHVCLCATEGALAYFVRAQEKRDEYKLFSSTATDIGQQLVEWAEGGVSSSLTLQPFLSTLYIRIIRYPSRIFIKPTFSLLRALSEIVPLSQCTVLLPLTEEKK